MKLEKTSRLIVLIFLIVFFAINALPLKTSGQQNLQVQNRNTGKTYETIQEAINAASVGDTLYVRNGTYYEHVVVNVTITLLGENKSNTIIDGEGRGSVILVTADDANIKGFTIQNSGRESITKQSGIRIDNSRGNKISDNIIKNSLYGIYIDHSHENSILNNTVSDNGHGIYLDVASNNLVSHNEALRNTHGIALFSATNNFFSGNNVSLNTVYAFSLSTCNDNMFSGNKVSNNTYGFRLSASTNNDLSGNNVSNNQQGFYLGASSYNTISGNNVSSSNLYGVWFAASSNNDFLNNYVVNNRKSFYLSTSYNNIIFHNNFINTQANTIQLPVCIGAENFWDNNMEGNYWSNHTWSDKNGDGVSDTAYVIDEKNKDNYPLIAAFTQFNILVEKKMYTIDVVSNSTISNFEYLYYPANRTTIVRFQVTNVGHKGFCRIRVPHTVIEPPYTVIIDHNVLYANVVHSNKTDSWLYFTYDYPEHEPSTISLLSQEQVAWYLLWLYAAIGLAGVSILLLLLVIKYHKTSSEQKKIIAAYELELKIYVREHLNTARALFENDVKRRKAKIKRFETKYNVKIRSRNSFEDVLRGMKFKKKEEEKAAN